MSKYPSEVFGYSRSASSPEARKARTKYWCPFVDKVCYKQSRLIKHPFGVCSAHVSSQEIALCPRRFLESHRVFSDVANSYFGTTANILVFAEIRLPDVGSFDFVMVKHKPLSTDIEDFVAIEFQTGQTTGTGQLVKGLTDLLSGKDVGNASYNFGINMYDIWKRTFTQVLNKGIIMESWGRKIYWVVQEPVYSNFADRYNLGSLEFNPKHSTVFALYDLKARPEKFEFFPTRLVSASIDQLFSAFRNNPNIPSQDAFLKTLKEKIQGEVQISLHLEYPKKTAGLDVKRPTATGRVREEPET